MSDFPDLHPAILDRGGKNGTPSMIHIRQWDARRYLDVAWCGEKFEADSCTTYDLDEVETDCVVCYELAKARGWPGR